MWSDTELIALGIYDGGANTEAGEALGGTALGALLRVLGGAPASTGESRP